MPDYAYLGIYTSFKPGKESSSSRNLTSESSPNSRDTTMAMQGLDPNCILDIERSARHLATSVDEMIENLSGLLQGNTLGISPAKITPLLQKRKSPSTITKP